MQPLEYGGFTRYIIGEHARPWTSESRRSGSLVAHDSKSDNIVATILVVDDETMVRQALRRLLEAKKHTCLEAGDGIEALKVLGQNDVDIAFVDLIMPHMDGLELMRRMREDYPAVKVVVISAFEEITDLAERQKDVVMTLKKPFTLSDVVDAIEQALEEA